MSKAQGYKHAAPPEQRQVSQICYCPILGYYVGLSLRSNPRLKLANAFGVLSN
jgi:hypothetical protein